MLLTATTIIIASLIGMGAGFLLGRGLLRSRRWVVVALSLLIVGVILTFLGAVRVTHGWQRRAWSSTAGTIIESRVEGVRAYHPEVVYEYWVDGVLYRDSTVLHQPSFGGRKRRHDVAVKEAALYIPGGPVTVFYDPFAPQNSDLLTSVFWADYAITGLGAMLVGLGVCFGLLWARRRPTP